MPRRFRHQRQSHPKKAVKSKLLQDAGMEHRNRHRRRGVRLRRPGVKREERHQNPKADQQQDINRFGSWSGEYSARSELLQFYDIERALLSRWQKIKANQADQENDAADR